MSVNPPDRGGPRNLGDRLASAGRSFHERLIRELQDAGYPEIRPAHGAVMANLEPGGSRVVDLAARAGMTKQSMGELVDDLETKGFVGRQPDPHDGRARTVVLTDKGRRHARAALRIIARMEREHRERLGEARYVALLAALEDLAAAGVRR